MLPVSLSAKRLDESDQRRGTSNGIIWAMFMAHDEPSHSQNVMPS